FLLECAIRATLVALGTAAVLGVMRVRRSAIHHTAWAAVVIVMLGLPLWSMAGPKLRLPVLQGAAAVGLRRPAPVNGPSRPMAEGAAPGVQTASSRVAPSAATRVDWVQILGATYLLGAGLLLMRLVAGTLYAIQLRRTA